MKKKLAPKLIEEFNYKGIHVRIDEVNDPRFGRGYVRHCCKDDQVLARPMYGLGFAHEGMRWWVRNEIDRGVFWGQHK